MLGTLRLGLNADFDRIHELANQHNTLRQMLGQSDWADDTQYNLQALKDNLCLSTKRWSGPVTSCSKKSPPEPLNERCDSFVVETNVYYPTDINLLFDALRKTIEVCAHLGREQGLTAWCQSDHNLRQLKRLYRRAQRIKPSTP